MKGWSAHQLVVLHMMLSMLCDLHESSKAQGRNVKGWSAHQLVVLHMTLSMLCDLLDVIHVV